MKYKTFNDWLLIKESQMKTNPMGGAGGPDTETKVKQAILQQAAQKGTSTEKVAQNVLKKAAQDVAADPNADIETAVKVGKALDKVKNADVKNMMPGKPMKKSMKK